MISYITEHPSQDKYYEVHLFPECNRSVIKDNALWTITHTLDYHLSRTAVPANSSACNWRRSLIYLNRTCCWTLVLVVALLCVPANSHYYECHLLACKPRNLVSECLCYSFSSGLCRSHKTLFFPLPQCIGISKLYTPVVTSRQLSDYCEAFRFIQECI